MSLYVIFEIFKIVVILCFLTLAFSIASSLKRIALALEKNKKNRPDLLDFSNTTIYVNTLLIN